jgi:hypothetical protein
MDIYCNRCGEPWEIDSLHDVFDGNGRAISYAEAAKRFERLGCGAFDAGDSPCNYSMVDPRRAAMAEAALALSGHPDDWAADMDLLDF